MVSISLFTIQVCICFKKFFKSGLIIPSFNKISIDRIIDICIPETVECIEPGTFADFVNLTEVVILGDVFGVEWKEGQWTAPLSPSTLVDELKRGRGKIIIHRK